MLQKDELQMENVNQFIQTKLFDLNDEKYKDFQCNLIPTISKGDVIGVRIPLLRKLQKELNKTISPEEISIFSHHLPHQYYDENNLHVLFINDMQDYKTCLQHLNVFTPYIDNWATCDLISPKIFQSNTEKLEDHIMHWLNSNQTYIIRLGITTLLTFYLHSSFNPKYLNWIAEIESNEYYVNMAIAWFFATALTKQYADSISYIENKSLPNWTHKKTIQKAVESYRIDDATKVYLKSLR